jgi:hypothetical protein
MKTTVCLIAAAALFCGCNNGSSQADRKLRDLQVRLADLEAHQTADHFTITNGLGQVYVILDGQGKTIATIGSNQAAEIQNMQALVSALREKYPPATAKK